MRAGCSSFTAALVMPVVPRRASSTEWAKSDAKDSAAGVGSHEFRVRTASEETARAGLSSTCKSYEGLCQSSSIQRRDTYLSNRPTLWRCIVPRALPDRCRVGGTQKAKEQLETFPLESLRLIWRSRKPRGDAARQDGTDTNLPVLGTSRCNLNLRHGLRGTVEFKYHARG